MGNCLNGSSSKPATPPTKRPSLTANPLAHEKNGTVQLRTEQTGDEAKTALPSSEQKPTINEQKPAADINNEPTQSDIPEVNPTSSDKNEEPLLVKKEKSSDNQQPSEISSSVVNSTAPQEPSKVQDSPADMMDSIRAKLALTKIQRQLKRKCALRAAKAEIQWKLFSELDTRDEAEMLSLAIFMQTLIDNITAQQEKEEKEKSENDDEGSSSSPRLPIQRSETLRELTKTVEEVDPVVVKLLREDSVVVQNEESDLSHFSPAGVNSLSSAPPPPPPGDHTLHADEEEASEKGGLIHLKALNFSPLAHKAFIPLPTKHHEYDLTHIKSFNASPMFLSEVIKLLRAEKRFSKLSVVKVLRLVYRQLKDAANITYLTIDDRSKLTVVGDLHGNLTDLLHIFDECGLPNHNNKFIFNGDFIDRGSHSFEVIFLLFLCYIIYGDERIIALNRGNHEENAITRVYGFEEEIISKYDKQIYEMFLEIFRFLPLFTVINNKIFVVHGGLFHNANVSIEDLQAINRIDYTPKPPVPFPQNCATLKENDAIYQEYLKQLQREALWSDPTTKQGIHESPRGAGILFGPDITKAFMKKNGFELIIRSHDCPNKRGFDFPYQPPSSASYNDYFNNIPSNAISETDDDEEESEEEKAKKPPLLCTVFSASNYHHGDNYGSILQFACHPFGKNSKPLEKNSSLFYVLKQYRTTRSSLQQVIETNRMSLKELILKKKSPLLSAFEAIDTMNHGIISRLEWSEVMSRVTMIHILWLSIITSIVPEACLVQSNAIDYRKFIAAYCSNPIDSRQLHQRSKSMRRDPSRSAHDDKKDAASPVEESVIIDDIYGQRKKLEKIFYFFDLNGDGVSGIVYCYVSLLFSVVYLYLVPRRLLHRMSFVKVLSLLIKLYQKIAN
jgi:diadenosine tetraphosphatase ApaH/serine/threonine PP2A family protein phosphatase/Ca2+-binding EF-hand superfamily protein